MALISIINASIAFGGDPLLDHASLHIERGERICLVGRNGCGKSTLMKLLAGNHDPDDGQIVKSPDVRVAFLPQEVPEGVSGTVKSIVESAERSHPASEQWEQEQAAIEIMTKLGLPHDAPFETLSGGMKRRVLLARALANHPDVLLLDEPTNHLDLDAIEWLEGFLMRRTGALLFVTHDRAFLRKLASRILDLDRGFLAGWDCSYDRFLQRKQQLLEDEEAIWEKKGKRLTQEEVWIRKGIKARRTRDEGRVRALLALREEFRQRLTTMGNSRLQMNEAGPSGALVVKAKNVQFGYPEKPRIISDLDLKIFRGERIGIIGPNGSGKTTLLKLITGALTPQSGCITLGTRLQTVYFDQMRHALDNTKTIAENLSDKGEMISIGGSQRHVYGYLQDFLFTPDRARTPVSALSGGERNRLMLALLFMQPCNLLIMDEPTNDLDMETLDLLEEKLQQTSSTLLLVSHDRDFLDKTVTSTLVFEGNGIIKSYAGGYSDWQEQRKQSAREVSQPDKASAKPLPSSKQRKLTNKERLELEQMETRVMALEAEQTCLLKAQCDPGFYQQAPGKIAEAQARIHAITQEIEQQMARWAELEEIES